MKNKNFVKITMLFLGILCTISLAIIMFKAKYVEHIEKELLQEIEEKVENIEESSEVIFADGQIGILKIESLNIEAPIYEGTDSETLKYAVGHFTNTSLWDGNVALASHNRGSYAHYFSKINELKNDEEIIYITAMGERRYKVTKKEIIDETNTKVLENTDENTITLITCVTLQKNKRQCVIAKEL